MSAQHFQGRFEVEFKYRLGDVETFATALAALNPEVMLERNQEQDTYFDTPDRSLSEAVNITDADKAISMLHTLGYQPILTLRKVRSIYFVGPFHVTLDHLAGLGDFAELAIMTDDEERLVEYRHALEALASTLGLKQREHRSYKELCELNQSVY